MKRTFHLLVVLASTIMMTGCSNDPTPSDGRKANYAATRFAVTKAGSPLEVEGCQVTVHRVTTADSDYLNDFTLAVAKCPTATVTSTEYSCGKSCHANNIVVQPKPQSIEPSDGSAKLVREAPTTQAAAKDAKVRELRAEVDRLSQEISRLEVDRAQ